MILNIIAILLAIWALTPLVLGTITTLLGFWTRKRITLSWGSEFMRKYWSLWDKNVKSDYQWECDYIYGLFIYILMHLILPVVLLGLAVCATKCNIWFEVGIVLGSLFLLTLPRYFLDICNCLKYSFKTRQSQEINDLKEAVEKLQKEK